MKDILKITTSKSTEKESIIDIADQLSTVDVDFALIFFSSFYDKSRLSNEIREHIKCDIYGCSTSGEIGTEDINGKTIVCIAYLKKSFSHKLNIINSLSNLNSEDLIIFSKTLHADNKYKNRFRIFLCDGLSHEEDRIVKAVNCNDPSIPIVGGSAADNLLFENTFLIVNNHIITNAAVVISVSTDLPFYTFKSEHVLKLEKKLHISKANRRENTVYEINGKNAVTAYAEAIGYKVKDIDSQIFFKYPLSYTEDGEVYVRSIQKINNDGSIAFYSPVDVGKDLYLSRTGNYINSLDRLFDEVNMCLIDVQSILCFECVLRKIEILDLNLKDRAIQNYKNNSCAGFYTYGEQYNGMHMNQTLTGIAFGVS